MENGNYNAEIVDKYLPKILTPVMKHKSKSLIQMQRSRGSSLKKAIHQSSNNEKRRGSRTLGEGVRVDIELALEAIR